MQPIYKMYLGRYSPDWFALSADEQELLVAEVRAAFAQVGGQLLIHCHSEWSNDGWHWFGVEYFPDLGAALRYRDTLAELGWQRYVADITVLGTQGGALFQGPPA